MKTRFTFFLMTSLISSFAHLQEMPSPLQQECIITRQPQNVQTCPGETAIFSVVTTRTDLHYQWKRGDTALSDNAKISGTSTPILTISPVDYFDAGLDYYCILSDESGIIDTSELVGIFQNVPVITFEPENVRAEEGNTVQLSVTAAGNNLSYQWMKGSTSLVDGDRIAGTTTSTLTILSASARDLASDYYVVAYSGCPQNDTSVRVAIEPAEMSAFAPELVTAVTLDATLNLPEGISPNNDGLNDVFVVGGIERYPGNELVIFNLQGERVMQTTDYQNNWSGTNFINHSHLPQGVYFFQLDLNTGQAPLNGSFYLLY